jgi:hypothetical protein
LLKINNMKKEFVTYKPALALRELGFDKDCLGYYVGKDKEVYISNEDIQPPFKPDLGSKVMFRAPTYSQAFRWFREKYEYYSEIRVGCTQIDGGIGYEWWVWKPNGIEEWSIQIPGEEWSYRTYEEAESACLDKLIEIVRERL